MALHPFTEALIAKMAAQPALSAGSPQDARSLVAASRGLLGEPAAVASLDDIEVPSRGGTVTVRRIRPTEGADGTIVLLHGGGWVVGALDDYTVYARALARQSNMAVLLVDYRLAPESPFPAALQDCEDVVAAVLSGSVDGLPAGPSIVMGDSAGANLATVLCRRLADRRAVAAQILCYPVTDSDFDRRSYREFGTGYPLTAQDMRWFFGHYTDPATAADPDVSPFRADDLAGMPATVIVTAEYDVLRDEGEDYARKLSACGVPVTLRRLPGVVHGFVRQHNLFDVAAAELRLISAEIRGLTLAG